MNDQWRCGPGRAAGRAAEADRLALLHGLSPLDEQLGHVAVGAEDAQAVIDDDGLAAEIEVAGHDHPAGVRRADGLAEGDAEVETRVERLQDVVVEPPLAEVRPGRRVVGRGERPVAQPFRRDDAHGQGDELGLPLDPGLDGGGRRDVVRVERELGRREFPLDDEEVLADVLDELARFRGP